MKTPVSKMRGITLIASLIIAAMVMVLLFIALKITPAYIDNYQIKLSMEGLSKEPDLKDLTKDELREMFSRRLVVNGVRNIVDPEQLDVERSRDKVELSLKYENKVHVIGNIHALFAFDNKVLIKVKQD